MSDAYLPCACSIHPLTDGLSVVYSIQVALSLEFSSTIHICERCTFSLPASVHLIVPRHRLSLASGAISPLFPLSLTLVRVSSCCALSCSMKNGQRVTRCFCGAFSTPRAPLLPGPSFPQHGLCFLVFPFLVFELTSRSTQMRCLLAREIQGGLFLSEWSGEPSSLRGRPPTPAHRAGAPLRHAEPTGAPSVELSLKIRFSRDTRSGAMLSLTQPMLVLVSVQMLSV